MPYGMLKICFILCLLLNMQIQMQMYYFELFRFVSFYFIYLFEVLNFCYLTKLVSEYERGKQRQQHHSNNNRNYHNPWNDTIALFAYPSFC